MSSAFSGGTIPAGVAADSFYQKATSVAALLKTLEGPGRIEDARTIAENSTSTPIWIATHPLDPEGTGLVMLPCHECLRIFPAHALRRDGFRFWSAKPSASLLQDSSPLRDGGDGRPGPFRTASRAPATQNQTQRPSASLSVPSFS